MKMEGSNVAMIICRRRLGTASMSDLVNNKMCSAFTIYAL